MKAEAMAGEEERDLLRRFAGSSQADERPEASLGDSGEIELSLGLSLGGCFGVEPSKKKLVRSSSIASLSMLPTTEHKLEQAAPLARTCSLPTEAEEEQRKRKEIQSLKRLEAKRKRLEKRSSRSLPAAKDRLEDEDVGGARFRGSAGGASSSGPPPWTAAAPGRAARRQVPALSTVSSSSAVSDFESRKLQGLNISGLSRVASSPSILQPMPENPSHQAATTPPMATGSSISCSREENPLSKETVVGGNGTGDMERSMMEDMPCVSTKGDGPNGKRIEGFLYKYRKGGEVRIVCVCHGSFLTPAEFVRHAGGGDVAHPLRHIVVNPTPSTFL